MPANRPVRVRDRTQKPICFFREPACRQGQRHRDDTTKIRNPKTPLSQGRGDISICRKYDSKRKMRSAQSCASHLSEKFLSASSCPAADRTKTEILRCISRKAGLSCKTPYRSSFSVITLQNRSSLYPRFLNFPALTHRLPALPYEDKSFLHA